MIVLDTNVLSELLRAAAEPVVLRWLTAQPPGRIHTTTVTRAEMLYGARLLEPGGCRQQLETSVSAMFNEGFASRVLPFDVRAADCYASIAADRRRGNRPISQFNAQRG